MLFTQMILAYSWWLWKSRIKTIMVLALQRSFTPEVKFNIVLDLEKNITFVRKPRRDFRLSTFDSFLMTSDFRLSTFDFRLSTFDFQLSFDLRLLTPDSSAFVLLPSAFMSRKTNLYLCNIALCRFGFRSFWRCKTWKQHHTSLCKLFLLIAQALQLFYL